MCHWCDECQKVQTLTSRGVGDAAAGVGLHFLHMSKRPFSHDTGHIFLTKQHKIYWLNWTIKVVLDGFDYVALSDLNSKHVWGFFGWAVISKINVSIQCPTPEFNSRGKLTGLERDAEKLDVSFWPELFDTMTMLHMRCVLGVGGKVDTILHMHIAELGVRGGVD